MYSPNTKGLGLNVKGVDASDRFLSALAGVSEPEEKRKQIGKVFIDVFDDEATKLKTSLGWHRARSTLT